MTGQDNLTDSSTKSSPPNGTQSPSITLAKSVLNAIAQQENSDETSQFFKRQLESWIGECQEKNKQDQLLEELNQKVKTMIDRVREALKSKRLKLKVQYELGLLLNQLLDIQDLLDPMLVEIADIAISILIDEGSVEQEPSLRQDKPGCFGQFLHNVCGRFWASSEQSESKNIIVARRIRKQIQREITIGKDQATTLVKGLSCFLLIGVGVPFLVLLLLSYVKPTRITLSEMQSRGQVHIKLTPDRTINVIAFGGKSLIVGPEEERLHWYIYSPSQRFLDRDLNRSDPASSPLIEASPTPAPSSGSATPVSTPPIGVGTSSQAPLQSPLSNNFLTATFGIDPASLIIVVIGGFIGSAVSILIRVQNFSYDKRIEIRSLFFTGLFKPIVGVAFALFIFATLESGLIKFNDRQPSERTYLYLAISFIAGFSERFAQDVLSKTENTLNGSSTPKKLSQKQ